MRWKSIKQGGEPKAAYTREPFAPLWFLDPFELTKAAAQYVRRGKQPVDGESGDPLPSRHERHIAKRRAEMGDEAFASYEIYRAMKSTHRLRRRDPEPVPLDLTAIKLATDENVSSREYWTRGGTVGAKVEGQQISMFFPDLRLGRGDYRFAFFVDYPEPIKRLDELQKIPDPPGLPKDGIFENFGIKLFQRALDESRNRPRGEPITEYRPERNGAYSVEQMAAVAGIAVAARDLADDLRHTKLKHINYY